MWVTFLLLCLPAITAATVAATTIVTTTSIVTVVVGGAEALPRDHKESIPRTQSMGDCGMANFI